MFLTLCHLPASDDQSGLGSCFCICWLVFSFSFLGVIWTQVWVIWDKEHQLRKRHPQDWSLGASYDIFLINDWCRRISRIGVLSKQEKKIKTLKIAAARPWLAEHKLVMRSPVLYSDCSPRHKWWRFSMSWWKESIQDLGQLQRDQWGAYGSRGEGSLSLCVSMCLSAFLSVSFSLPLPLLYTWLKNNMR